MAWGVMQDAAKCTSRKASGARVSTKPLACAHISICLMRCLAYASLQPPHCILFLQTHAVLRCMLRNIVIRCKRLYLQHALRRRGVRAQDPTHRDLYIGVFFTQAAAVRAADLAMIGLLGRDCPNLRTLNPLDDYSAVVDTPQLKGTTREQAMRELRSWRARARPRKLYELAVLCLLF